MNKISKSFDTDRIEFERKNIDIIDRFDLKVDYYIRNYIVGAGYGRLRPKINEIVFRGIMREKQIYSLGIEVNTSSVTSGLSFLGSRYIDVKGYPFIIDGKIALFKDYGCFQPGIRLYYSKSGNLSLLSNFIDVHKERIKKTVGFGFSQIIDKRNGIKSEVRYSTKNGIEFLAEPHFRTNNLFVIALESYVATRNNSAFGVSLIYLPVKVKVKIAKKPVKVVVKEPVRKPVKKEEVTTEQPVNEKPEKVKISPEKLKAKFNQIVNSHYTKGVNLYCEDKFEEAIKEWQEALRLLNDESFKDYKDAIDYKERCKRNIEDAKKKLEIIHKE